MQQRDIARALAAWVERDDTEPWRQVIEAIRSGEIVVADRSGTLILRAIERPAVAAFGERLNLLWKRSGRTQQDLAEALGVSSTSIIRQLHGQTLSPWPVIAMLVAELGGNPQEFREDYDRAKSERRS